MIEDEAWSEITADLHEFRTEAEAIIAGRPQGGERIWTTEGEYDDEVIPLDVKSDRAVWFDTGAGIIHAWIEDGSMVVVGGKIGDALTLTPLDENVIRVGVVKSPRGR